MRKFRRGDSVIVVRRQSMFFGTVGVICNVLDEGWKTFQYEVKFPDYDNRPMVFEETELAKVV